MFNHFSNLKALFLNVLSYCDKRKSYFVQSVSGPAVAYKEHEIA